MDHFARRKSTYAEDTGQEGKIRMPTVSGNSSSSDPAVHGINTNIGPGILGESTITTTGAAGAVIGRSAGLAPGVLGDSGQGFGVEGKGELGGVHGSADGFNRDGVRGDAPQGTGVAGTSNQLIGVSGFGPTGVYGLGSSIGVHGVGRTGVKAELTQSAATVGFALQVVGKSSFSTSGAGNIPKGASSATVANPAVTAQSHITVALAGNPGRAELRWVDRQPGTGFIVHLTRKVKTGTPFTFLIVEP
jgi:hypothetical protein